MALESPKYSKRESLQRIYNILKGNPITNASPEILGGDPDSEDESLSHIAAILSGFISGEVLHEPTSLRHDYGGIYAWTGTSSLTSMTSASYTKITGTFQNSMYTDGVTASPSGDRLTLTQSGMYFVQWSLSYIGSSAVTYKVEPYHAALGTPQAAAVSQPYSSGTVVNMSGSGIFIASGSAEVVDLRLLPSATAWMIPQTVELWVQRIGDYR